MTISRYAVVSDDSLAGLAKEVNQYIVDGWLPLGGISSTKVGESLHGEVSFHYLQAMIKEEPEGAAWDKLPELDTDGR